MLRTVMEAIKFCKIREAVRLGGGWCLIFSVVFLFVLFFF